MLDYQAHCFFAAMGISLFISGLAKTDYNLRHLTLEQRNYYILTTAKRDGYKYIGEVVGVDSDGKSKFLHLFIKTIEGKRYYYCSFDSYVRIVDKELVKRKNYKGIVHGYIIDFDFDWDNVYVND